MILRTAMYVCTFLKKQNLKIDSKSPWQIPKNTYMKKLTFENMQTEISITVIDREGNSHNLTTPTDLALNVMEVCKLYELPVKGECGGMAMCATCQIYVESDTDLPEQGDAELAMLDQAFFVKNNSRLGCQLHINPSLDGLVIRLAPE